MDRVFTFAVAAALAVGMSTMAWSQSDGGGSAGASSSNKPQVRTRANHSSRQYLGYNAFNDSRIRRQLDLSQDQIRQLRALNNSWRQQLQRFRRGSGNNLNSADPTQLNEMWQQYATTVSDVLTAQQQQTLSQLISQFFTFSPNTMVVSGGSAAPAPSPNSSARAAAAGQTSTTDTNASSFKRSAAIPNQPYRISISNQALGGYGSSAVGTAQLKGQPIGLNAPGPTQVQQGGGSSYFGTLLLNQGGP